MARDKNFEELLRGYLPFLDAAEPLEADTDLRNSGLGSLEGAYGIRFVNEALSLDTFATPAVLWETVTRLQAAA